MKYIFYLAYLILICSIIYYLYFYTEIFIQNIPKIIIQTWKTDNVPNTYTSYVETLKELHPDYQYIFFTDETIEDFLKSNYPQYYETYKKLPIKIQKIDFFRYIAIYHYGGFYLDLDMKCNQNFDALLRHNCVFPVDDYIPMHKKHIHRYSHFIKNNQRYLIGQYAFASVPNHPFIKLLINDIHENINIYIKHVNADNDDYVYQTTGPDFVTLKYMQSKNKHDIFILDNKKRQCFGDYATHLCMGSWK